MRNAKRAVEYEAKRLIELTEKGEPIIQQTRSFDANNGTTFATRDKEDADDYRYFADPDLTPFQLEDEYIAAIKKTIPALQAERVKKYTNEWHLPEYDALVLTEERETADYFETIVQHNSNYKAAANWMLGPVKSWLNEHGKSIVDFPLLPEKIAAVIQLVDTGKLSFSIASTRFFNYLLVHPDAIPAKAAEEQNLIQQSDSAAIEPIVDEVLLKFADKVQEYKKGKKGVLSLFVGEVMKRSKGKADPKVTNQLIVEKLK
jgi:aspartyl-tRNA(Asn)/glutamyl-tRNA(Gln) amidotransferase subunit B